VHKVWQDQAWEDYLSWQNDRRTLKRIHMLIQSIERNGTSCIGDPEPLRGNLAGWWSVRINEKDRIVFRIIESKLEILSCRGHYN